MTSYDSDGFRVYARNYIPAQSAPEAGNPVVVFLHGWAGKAAAPDIRFY